MKKVVRLTEADLVRIVKRVIKEQGITGRNNPRWVKLFNVLRNIGSPKVLTFKDFDGNPSQSLNWGTAKGPNGKYGLSIPSTDSKMPKERIILFNSDFSKTFDLPKATEPRSIAF